MICDKSKIQRGDLRSNDLKRIIVRIDFTGVSNIDDYIKALIRRTLKPANVRQYVRGAYVRNQDEVKATSKLLGVAEREINESSIHRFSHLKQFEPNEVYVDITENSIELTIKCKSYDGFDTYNILIGDLLKELRKHAPFLNLKRIGIRKSSAFLALDSSDLRKRVEEKIFPNPIVIETNPHCSYIDSFVWEEKNIKCRLTRELQSGYTESISNEERKTVFQFSLDYDLYMDGNMIPQDERIETILNKINDLHFFLFKESISYSYLILLCNGR